MMTILIFALQVPPSSGSAFHWVPACFMGSCTEAHQTYASSRSQAQVWFPGQFPHDRVWGFDRQHFMCHLTSKKSQRAFSFWAIGIRHRKLNEMEAMVERNSEMPDESDALMYVSVFWQH